LNTSVKLVLDKRLFMADNNTMDLKYRVTIRLEKKQFEYLKKTARRLYIPVSQIIRSYVQIALDMESK